MKINDLPQRKPPEIHERKRISNSRFFHVEEINLTFSNGEQRVYERLIAPPLRAVLIVPMINEDTVLLIQEYAGGTDRYELGLPKGAIDPGETAMQAADRELKEEVGFGASKLTHLKNLTLAPGYMSHGIQVILAEELYAESIEGDEPEPIQVFEHPIADIESLVSRDDFSEARSIAALFMVREILKKRKTP
ncbi:MAG: ADP compounds hydrolase NudE [Pseudomonadota bacterium]|nr:ADP compounds hydrolase NudE [Pseudomonadota bacterium]